MVRAPCFDKNGIKKGAWSEDEDNKLRACVERYGHPNWREVPKLAGLSRCGKSCRLRWMNYLRPNVKHGNFTKEEEALITHLHNRLGNKWSKMAELIPGRSDNEIKNHWNAHLKNQVKKDQTLLKNEQYGRLEPLDANANAGQWPLGNPKEVEILLAVLSSDLESASSTSKSSPGSLSVSDYVVPNNVTPQILDTTGNFWTEPFLPDSVISSPSDNNFVSLGLDDDIISQTSLQDYIIDDMYLWST